MLRLNSGIIDRFNRIDIENRTAEFKHKDDTPRFKSTLETIYKALPESLCKPKGMVLVTLDGMLVVYGWYDDTNGFEATLSGDDFLEIKLITEKTALQALNYRFTLNRTNNW